jgi:hypothetical protein
MLNINGSGRSRQQRLDPVMETRRVSGAVNPLPTTKDVVITKRITVPLSTTESTPLTVANLVSALPSGTFEIRLQKISFYGNSTDAASSELNVADLTSDLAAFVDFGTPGHQRSQIHLTPAFELRQKWFTSSDTTGIYTVNGTAVVQATVEVRYS